MISGDRIVPVTLGGVNRESAGVMFLFDETKAHPKKLLSAVERMTKPQILVIVFLDIRHQISDYNARVAKQVPNRDLVLFVEYRKR